MNRHSETKLLKKLIPLTALSSDEVTEISQKGSLQYFSESPDGRNHEMLMSQQLAVSREVLQIECLTVRTITQKVAGPEGFEPSISGFLQHSLRRHTFENGLSPRSAPLSWLGYGPACVEEGVWSLKGFLYIPSRGHRNVYILRHRCCSDTLSLHIIVNKGMNMSETHLGDLKFRLMTIDLLRTAKRQHTYRELSLKTGLPVTVLSRYVKGHVLPSSKRAKTIWTILEKIVGLEEELRRRIRFDEMGYFDNTSIVGDSALLHQAAENVFSKFAGKRITKVLTAAVDGIPLATAVATALGVDLVIAKKAKEIGVKEFLEETYILGNSATVTSLYIPKGSIKKSDSVLIVDDVIKSGESLRAMANLITKARASVAGIYALVSIGDDWRGRLEPLHDYPVEVVLKVRP